MKPIVRVLTALCVAAGFVCAASHGEEPSKTADLMQQKLKASQKVLEGLSKGDFDAIETNAEALLRISHQAEWSSVKSADYELFTNQFRRAADDLVKNAKEKNLDGAALGYVEMTLTCVKCHKYVRGKGMTRLDDLRRSGAE